MDRQKIEKRFAEDHLVLESERCAEQHKLNQKYKDILCQLEKQRDQDLASLKPIKYIVNRQRPRPQQDLDFWTSYVRQRDLFKEGGWVLYVGKELVEYSVSNSFPMQYELEDTVDLRPEYVHRVQAGDIDWYK